MVGELDLPPEPARARGGRREAHLLRLGRAPPRPGRHLPPRAQEPRGRARRHRVGPARDGQSGEGREAPQVVSSSRRERVVQPRRAVSFSSSSQSSILQRYPVSTALKSRARSRRARRRGRPAEPTVPALTLRAVRARLRRHALVLTRASVRPCALGAGRSRQRSVEFGKVGSRSELSLLAGSLELSPRAKRSSALTHADVESSSSDLCSSRQTVPHSARIYCLLERSRLFEPRRAPRLSCASPLSALFGECRASSESGADLIERARRGKLLPRD